MGPTRRTILQHAGFLLPAVDAVGGLVSAAETEPPVWKLDGDTYWAVRRVPADQCHVPQLATPAVGTMLEARVRLDEGAVIGLVLNSDSGRGPRYVVALERGAVRVYEFAWPGKNWYKAPAAVEYGRAFTIRMALSRNGVRSRLKIEIAGKLAIDCQLPARLDAFFEPGVFVFDAKGAVGSLRVMNDKGAWQTILPPRTGEAKDRPDVLFQAQGEEAMGRKIEAAVREVRQATDVPALACAVVRGKELVAAAVDGVRRHGSSTPVTLADRFHIGSNTKSMTATLLGLLIEQKRVASWQTPLEKLLPDLAGSMHADYRSMPLSFLVHQTTGILDSSERGLDYGAKGNSIADQRTLRARQVLAVKPDFKPGSKFNYQNINFVVAGAVVDRLAGGESWEQAIRTHLLTPLGITTAGYGPMGLPGTEAQPYGHTRQGDTLKPIWGDNPPSLGPAGTLHLSVMDFARYARLHLMAELGIAPGLLSVAALQELHKPLNGYGKGWGVSGPDAKGQYNLSHRGSNTMNTADITIRPGVEMAVVVMTNESPFGDGHGGKAVSQLTERILKS